MKNLINFFFSFDKLMKEKLILPFFWLAVISSGMFFTRLFVGEFSEWLADVVTIFEFFVWIVLAIVTIRLVCELSVATFRINDNLSPDGGKSETADIDPMLEARKVAEAAAERAREAAKIAGEKTQAATKSARESMSGIGNKTSDASKAVKPKATPSRKTAPKNPVAKSKRAKAPVKTSTKTAPKKALVKKYSTTGAKRGPKPGVKVRRDAQGRLLKKDGTLRAKPGPKT